MRESFGGGTLERGESRFPGIGCSSAVIPSFGTLGMGSNVPY